MLRRFCYVGIAQQSNFDAGQRGDLPMRIAPTAMTGSDSGHFGSRRFCDSVIVSSQKYRMLFRGNSNLRRHKLLLIVQCELGTPRSFAC